MQPKVFVSHASEDKDRFVTLFATKLRENGVEAWLDRWEMLPGDSLVDKIFEEGIKEAKAVIVVLSQFSVDKPWVREELNAAVVKRINNGSKLIPVVIDDCEVPEVLKSTLWERVEDLTSFQPNLDRILASIFGATNKPPLGPPPAYTKSFAESIGGLNNVDSLTLRLACEHALMTGYDMIDSEKVFFKEGNFVIPKSELTDSLEILDQHGYIRLHRVIGGGIFDFKITTFGFDVFANACLPDFQALIKSVISALVNRQLTDNLSIAKELGQPRILIDHIFDVLEMKGFLKQSKSIGMFNHVYNLSPSLKRSLE